VASILPSPEQLSQLSVSLPYNHINTNQTEMTETTNVKIMATS